MRRGQLFPTLTAYRALDLLRELDLHRNSVPTGKALFAYDRAREMLYNHVRAALARKRRRR